MLPHTASLQGGVINFVPGETFFIIKKVAGRLNGPMQLVFVRHRDPWVALEEVGQRARASFLRACDDEIQRVGRLAFGFKEHGNSSAKVVCSFEQMAQVSR